MEPCLSCRTPFFEPPGGLYHSTVGQNQSPDQLRQGLWGEPMGWIFFKAPIKKSGNSIEIENKMVIARGSAWGWGGGGGGE